jgi:DNA-binding FadR family transcriptional regulator
MAQTEPPVARGTLPTHTARRIIRDFVARGLQPGDGLADEASLTERYGVSRATLREALRLLTFLGAVTVKAGPGGGPRLTTPGPAVVGSALGMVVQFQGATLRTVFEARLGIEPSVAALAAANRGDVDIDRLEESVAALRTHQRKRGPEYAGHGVRYTLRVGAASHNAVLASLVPALAAMTTTVRWRYPRGARISVTDRVATVVDAIKRGDGATASDATRWTIQILVDGLEAEQPDALDRRILWPEVDEVLGTGQWD